MTIDTRNPSILSSWATPVYLQRHLDSNVNRSLAALVGNLASPNLAKGLTSVGGARTKADLLRIDDPAVKTLTGYIREAVGALVSALDPEGRAELNDRELIAEAWGNVYCSCDFQLPHVHRGSHWSGVYYALIPEDRNAYEIGPGELVLYDPGPRHCAGLGRDSTPVRIVPEEGLLVAFPSWLKHSVMHHRCDTQRISIAFNVAYE